MSARTSAAARRRTVIGRVGLGLALGAAGVAAYAATTGAQVPGMAAVGAARRAANAESANARRADSVSAAGSGVTPSARQTPAAAVPVRAAEREAGDSATASQVTFDRELYVYAGNGRRDPFASLIKAGGELRPMLAELRLVTILVGSDGRNSVAIMRDAVTKEQYRRHVGEGLGRMRVARIEPRQVVFTIEEFGYSRQEVLTYGDSTTTRTR